MPRGYASLAGAVLAGLALISDVVVYVTTRQIPDTLTTATLILVGGYLGQTVPSLPSTSTTATKTETVPSAIPTVTAQG